jgi:hypothetical protein
LAALKLRRFSSAVATSREGQQRKRRKTKIALKLSLTGPRLAKLLQVFIGLLRPQQVERLRRLRGLRVAIRLLVRDVSESASSAEPVLVQPFRIRGHHDLVADDAGQIGAALLGHSRRQLFANAAIAASRVK